MNATAKAYPLLDQSHFEWLIGLLHSDKSKHDEPHVHRIYFLDVDVLSDYVNGKCGNYRSGWSSLLSKPQDKKSASAIDQNSPEARLADAIASTVPSFLLHPFRRKRHTQGPQLLLTPEHEREWRALLHSVAHAQNENDSAEIYDGAYAVLNSRYKQLMEDGLSPADQTAIFESIAAWLVANAAMGKTTRALDAANLVAAQSQLLLHPKPGYGRPFVLRCDTPEYEAACKKRARSLLGMWLHKKALPAFYARLHEVVLEVHAPSLRMLHYENAVSADQKLSDLLDAEQGVRARVDASEATTAAFRKHFTRQAIKRISDVVAYARLQHIAELLQQHHPLAQGGQWELVLISGAPIMRELHELALPESPSKEGYADEMYGHTKQGVRLTHPLSVMRFDEFLRPLGARSKESSFELSGEEYALAVIKGDSNSAHVDADGFFESLQALLAKAQAGFAPVRDNSLRNIKRVLALRDTGDKQEVNTYTYRLSQIICHDFVKTFVFLNQYTTTRVASIPSAVPWLRLPLSLDSSEDSAADRFCCVLHGQESHIDSSRSLLKLFQQTQTEDPTGYTAATCAALGYLAMGKGHFEAAETVANAAARMALIVSQVDPSVRGEYVPEGNEALYLSAFVSRMRVHPELPQSNIKKWAEIHAATMQHAMLRAQFWKSVKPEARQTIVGTKLTPFDHVQFRYDIEKISGRVFEVMVLGLGGYEGWVEAAQQLHDDQEHARHICTWSASKVLGADAPDGELKFLRAQAFACLVQMWIVLKVYEDEHALQSDVAKRVAQCALDFEQAHQASKSREQPWGGAGLCHALSTVLHRHADENAPVTKAKQVFPGLPPYAEFDERYRIPALRHLFDLSPKASFANSIFVQTCLNDVPCTDEKTM